MRNLSLIILSSIIFVGCTTVKGPIMSYPDVPEMIKDSASITITREQSQIDPADVVYATGFQIQPGSTVVISVPTDYVKESVTKDTETIRDAQQLDTVDANVDLYNTSGYFNYAEQQIEKALIRVGFNVIDRSKFEAKLRDSRSRVEITHTEGGAQRIDRAHLDELQDISELIRAAQDGAIRSDYILQINQLQLKKNLVTIDLQQNQQLELLKDKYPEIASEFPKIYRFPEYSVTFNAKLIDVKTGRIVWLGSHVVSSRNIIDEDITLTVTVRKYVMNEKKVFAFIDYQNTEEQRKLRGKSLVPLPAWQYEYKLDKAVTPDLNELELPAQKNEGTDKQSENSQDRFFSHRDQLLKLVSTMLIQTIAK